MKKKALRVAFVGLLTFIGGSSFASNQIGNNITILVNDSTVEEFKVYGNCGMCKKIIEGSLIGEESVYSAVWSKETKMIEVNFNKDDISLDDIKKKIAEVGYDTQEYRASDKVYNGLPGCCQYERPEEK